jgi:anaerobic magnesium-protoporphyrin IX monomethyl ester cyclase
MDVLFVQDNGYVESLGICEISTFLKCSGFSVGLMLLSHEKTAIEQIRHLSPKIVAISCMTGYHKNLLSFMDELKHNINGIFTIMGGAHPTFYPEVLENCNCLDAICIGEGELAMVELTEAICSGKEYININNLHIKRDEHIKKNPLRKLITDFDMFPIPDRALYYDSYPFLAQVSMKRFISGRGCPYQCSFCFNHQYNTMYRGCGPIVRKKSVERVLSEIDEVARRWTLLTVHFSDDTFMLDLQWFERFCKSYKTVDIPFTINARFDQITETSIQLLKEAGCIGCSLGLESGSEKIRNQIFNKKLANQQIERGANLLQSGELSIMTTNIIGVPDETVEDAMNTIRFNLKIKSNFGRMYFLWPMPNLKITSYALKTGYLPKEIHYDSYDTSANYTTENAKEYKIKKNIANIFSFVLLFPWSWPILKRCLRWPTFILMPFGLFSTWSDVLFYKVKLASGFYYFINVISGVISGNLFRFNERFFSRSKK